MESNNVKYKELEKIIKACDVRPGRNRILITVNTYEIENDILDISGDQNVMMDEWQYVVAGGTGAMYKPGDKIMLELDRLIKRIPDPEEKHKTIEVFDLPGVAIAGKMFAIVSDSYVLADRDNKDEAEKLSV